MMLRWQSFGGCGVVLAVTTALMDCSNPDPGRSLCSRSRRSGSNPSSPVLDRADSRRAVMLLGGAHERLPVRLYAIEHNPDDDLYYLHRERALSSDGKGFTSKREPEGFPSEAAAREHARVHHGAADSDIAPPSRRLVQKIGGRSRPIHNFDPSGAN